MFNHLLICPLPINYGSLDDQYIKYVDLNYMVVRDSREAGVLGNSALPLCLWERF